MRKVLYGLIAVLLAAIVTFTLIKRQNIDHQRYDELIGKLREIKYLDEDCNKNILKTRSFLLTNYDPLVRYAQDIKEFQGNFASSLAQSKLDNPGLQHSLRKLEALHQEKIRQIEWFKAANSILRNSISSITVMSNRLVRASASTMFVLEMNAMVKMVLIYNANPSLLNVEELQRQIRKVEGLKAVLPSRALPIAELVISHARIILVKKDYVDRVIGEILEMPTSVLLDGMYHEVYNGFTVAVQRNETLNLLLYAAIALLIITVVLVIVKLAASRRQLEQLNLELEDRVADRTRALEKSRKKLQKTLDGYEKINKELDQFAYVISHDLKAPLRAISSLASWIADDYKEQFDEEGKAQLDLMLQRVKRMESLINGVLQYSRVGRTEENDVQFASKEVIEEVIDALAPPEHIAVRANGDFPSLYSQRTRVYQLLQNIVSNAIKYNDKPEGQVDIWCEEEHDHWKFFVKDNGPGIDEKHFESVFEIFQTIRPKDEYESTGVGLTIVKKTVELLGGEIGLTSELGQGCTFNFTLPKKEAPAEESETAEEGDGAANVEGEPSQALVA